MVKPLETGNRGKLSFFDRRNVSKCYSNHHCLRAKWVPGGGKAPPVPLWLSLPGGPSNRSKSDIAGARVKDKNTKQSLFWDDVIVATEDLESF